MVIIKYIIAFFKSLNSNSHPGDVAHAVSFGLILALMPKNNAFWILLFCITMFIRMNKGAFFISLILFGLISPFFDVWFDSLGYAILSLEFLKPTYTALYNIPFVGWTKFNNSIVMGSFVAGLILYFPVYKLGIIGVKTYRKKIPGGIFRKISNAAGKVPLLQKIISIFMKGNNDL